MTGGMCHRDYRINLLPFLKEKTFQLTGTMIITYLYYFSNENYKF